MVAINTIKPLKVTTWEFSCGGSANCPIASLCYRLDKFSWKVDHYQEKQKCAGLIMG